MPAWTAEHCTRSKRISWSTESGATLSCTSAFKTARDLLLFHVMILHLAVNKHIVCIANKGIFQSHCGFCPSLVLRNVVYLQNSRPESRSSSSNAWTCWSRMTLVCRFFIQYSDTDKENRYIQFGDIIANVFHVNSHQCLADTKWQLFVVWRGGQPDRDVILVWMMCLYQSSVLADGLLNPSDTVSVCVCVCVRQLNDWPLWLQLSSGSLSHLLYLSFSL